MTLIKGISSFSRYFFKSLSEMGSIHWVVVELGCKAAMKVRGDDTLEGAHSLSRFLREISSFSGDFLKTLSETGSIHWEGVQTWLRSSHEGKR